MVSLEEVIKRSGVSTEYLERECPKEDVINLLGYIPTNWKLTGAHLGLSGKDLSDIDEENKKVENKRLTTLYKWKSKFAFKATYYELVKAFHESGENEESLRLCEYLASKDPASKGNKREVSVNPSVNRDFDRPMATVIQYKGDSLTLSTTNIKIFLKEEDFPASKARSLGEFLGIKQGRISTLKTNSGDDPDTLLSNIITEWLNNDSEKSWQKLAKAIRLCDHSLMADELISLIKK